MSDFHSLPEGSMPSDAIRNNGPDQLVLERFKLRELAEGWPCYRDACEWKNFRSIFHSDAFVYTTWTGRISIADFIQASQDGMDNGAFIMHRAQGITSDISTIDPNRAVTKMKACITQRFLYEGVELDVDCDCRFVFFWEKRAGEWGASYVRHWYEKDKVILVNPGTKMPALDMEKWNNLPKGYRNLAYFQEATMGVDVKMDLPTHRNLVGAVGSEEHDKLYFTCKDWLDGKRIVI